MNDFMKNKIQEDDKKIEDLERRLAKLKSEKQSLENLKEKRKKEAAEITKLLHTVKFIQELHQTAINHLHDEYNILKNMSGGWIDGSHIQCVKTSRGDTYTGPGSLWDGRSKEWRYDFEKIKVALKDLKPFVDLMKSKKKTKTPKRKKA